MSEHTPCVCVQESLRVSSRPNHPKHKTARRRGVSKDTQTKQRFVSLLLLLYSSIVCNHTVIYSTGQTVKDYKLKLNGRGNI